jgi:excisionase family DNA binding protein
MSKSLDRPAIPFDQRISVSVRDAAEIIGIGRSTLYEHIKAGTLTTVKIGSRRLVLVDSIRNFVERGGR